MKYPAAKLLFGLIYDQTGNRREAKRVAVVFTSKRPLKRARAKAMRANVAAPSAMALTIPMYFGIK
jgi:hypothetical protein